MKKISKKSIFLLSFFTTALPLSAFEVDDFSLYLYDHVEIGSFFYFVVNDNEDFLYTKFSVNNSGNVIRYRSSLGAFVNKKIFMQKNVKKNFIGVTGSDDLSYDLVKICDDNIMLPVSNYWISDDAYFFEQISYDFKPDIKLSVHVKSIIGLRNATINLSYIDPDDGYDGYDGKLPKDDFYWNEAIFIFNFTDLWSFDKYYERWKFDSLKIDDVLLNSDDDNAIYPREVPVPAAVWLFGSALAGLVGVRRRK